MTVSSEISKTSHTVTITTFTYTYNFLIYKNSDVKVTDTDTNGTVVTKSLGVDYSVTGVGTGSGNIVFVVAPIVGHKLTFVRAAPYLQETALPLGGKFPSQSVEVTEDYAVMMAQRLKEITDRCFRVQEGDDALNEEIPVATLRAGKILAFDSLGEPDVTENVGVNRGDWLTGVTYQGRDIVISLDIATAGNAYTAVTTHTSGVFATDLAAGKWKILFDLQGAVSDVDLQAAQQGNYIYGETTGTEPTYILTLNPVPAGAVYPRTIHIKIHSTNAAGAATINPNGLGAVGLLKFDGATDFAANELVVGQIYTFNYDDTNYIQQEIEPLSKTIADPGRYILPGGLIMQWGRAALHLQGSYTVTYPVAFPTDTLHVQLTLVEWTGTLGVAGIMGTNRASWNAAGFDIDNQVAAAPDTHSFGWLAIGH